VPGRRISEHATRHRSDGPRPEGRTRGRHTRKRGEERRVTRIPPDVARANASRRESVRITCREVPDRSALVPGPARRRSDEPVGRRAPRGGLTDLHEVLDVKDRSEEQSLGRSRPGVALDVLCIHTPVTECYLCWVTPFGNAFRVIKIVKKKRELFLGQRLMSLCSLTLP
jgi:hypothetical protein